MPKFDLKAYRACTPVSSLFAGDETALSFGLLSAPFTYDCRYGGIHPADFTPDTRSTHYLDDFITTGRPESGDPACT